MERSLSCVLLVLCGLWSSVCPVPLAINKTVGLGRDVTLVPRYTGDPSEINWKINGNKLVDMELRPREDPVFYRLQGRATINHTDGVLTIRDLTKGDSGVYRAEVLLNNVYQVTEINLMVLDESVPPTFTSSTGPPNIHVTSATKGPSFNSSHGPPETKKTKSHTEGPSSRSTTHSTKVKQSGMSDSTRQVILIVVGLVVMGVFVGCLLWCFCCGKERKQTYNTKDPYTAGLLGAGKSEETEAGNDVKSGVKGSSLDTSGTETEARNDVKSGVKGSSLDTLGTDRLTTALCRPLPPATICLHCIEKYRDPAMTSQGYNIRRQKRTSAHNLLLLRDLPPGSSLSPAPYCSLHPLEELGLFCEVCAVPSCRDCALLKHHGHELRPVVEVAVKHKEQLRGALIKWDPQLEGLEKTLNAVYRVGEDLRQRADMLREEVEVFTEGYIQAVQEHRLRLLRDIDEEVHRKEQGLNLQKARVHQQLSDLRTATSFTRGLLHCGPDHHIVRAKVLALSRLKDLSHGDRSKPEHVEPVGIRFSPLEEAGLCQGYQLYGAVQRGEVDPDRCEVKGQGLHSGALGALCSFTLISKNKVEEPREQPRVTILHKESGRALQPSIQDNHDGTFHISYTPTEVGQLSASVCVKGRHIKGSPFNVTVRGTLRSHPGIYHCCTFCSSGGQKDARCGCGGTMPGGYQGCGHGHKGHPGHSHWSCCGSILEKSECSGVKDSAPRNLLRTVAL